MSKKFDYEKLAKLYKDEASMEELMKEFEINKRSIYRNLKVAHEKGFLKDDEYPRIIELGVLDERGFPSELDDQMESVLSSVNTEPKQIALLALEETPQIKYHVLNKITDKYVDTDRHWYPGHKALDGYLEETLLPIGFLTKKEVIKHFDRPRVGWSLSPSGKKYGRPIAAFSLKYAVENESSLFPLLGRTASRGEIRAPLVTYKTLNELSKTDLMLSELEKRVGSSTIAGGRGAKRLINQDLIEYEVPEERMRHPYKWKENKKPEDAKPVKDHRTLTNSVAPLLYKFGRADRVELSKELDIDSPERINPVLSGLEDQGFIEPDYFASITQKGKDFFNNYLKKVEEALSGGSELKLMKEMEDEFRETDIGRRYAEKGMDLYSEVSPTKKRRDPEERKEMILKFIKSYESEYKKSPRWKEIIRECEGAGVYLSELLEEGKVERIKKTYKTWYTIP